MESSSVSVNSTHMYDRRKWTIFIINSTETGYYYYLVASMYKLLKTLDLITKTNRAMSYNILYISYVFTFNVHFFQLLSTLAIITAVATFFIKNFIKK